jgi:hypothetical protein
MKTRSHKKYRKRVVRKTRRNKVGGGFLEYLGFGSAPVVQQSTTLQQQPLGENFSGKKEKENVIPKIGGKRTRKHKKSKKLNK